MRKITLTIIIFFILIISFYLVYPKNNNEILETNEKGNNLVSIMIQDEQGNYQESDLNDFNQEGYRFNKSRSKCLMGSKINYQDGNIEIKATKSDKCYAYFDNNLVVQDLSGNGYNGIVPSSANWISEGITINSGMIDCGITPNQLGDNYSLIVRFKISKQFGLKPTYQHHQIFGGITSFYLEYSTNGIWPYFQAYYNETLHDNAYGDKININEFYTIVGTYDYNNRTMFFYNNGVKEGESAITDKRVMAKTAFSLGYDFTFSDVFIFNRTLTAEEIAQDYANKINPTNKQDLLLWYKFT